MFKSLGETGEEKMVAMLGVEDLKKYLDSIGIRYMIVEVPEAATSGQASRSLGIGLERIAKTVVFKSDSGETLLVVVRADKKVDQGRLAKMLGYKKLRLATFEEVVEDTGYPPGGVPPVGHKKKLVVYVDSKLLGGDFYFVGGGDDKHLLEVSLREIAERGFALPLDVPVKSENNA
ncbi:YbaK/prolyl-tRNA synthetase associated region [Thermofilum adornatum 1505]|jgi:Cys-tRNA(Pro) deacylase|uniref:YbaK/prolyl-tRNA synthetase associated region n=2 Tax=Thermofilum adornatum TaxID=1365176 RepID=A0A3G1A688_9CREN|nr:YbaK/prolyl-tRNA synthetase associated region [Thermofilum adornatum 1505]